MSTISVSDIQSEIISFVTPNQTTTLKFKLKISNPVHGANSTTVEINVGREQTENTTDPVYFEDFDLNGDGVINILDAQQWALDGRPDIAQIVVDIYLGNLPMPPFMDDPYIHFPEGVVLMQMMQILHSIGYTNFEDLDVTGDGIIDIGDGIQIREQSGDSRPLEFINRLEFEASSTYDPNGFKNYWFSFFPTN